MKYWAEFYAAVLILVGLFAPLLANDLPLVASVRGELSFPAFHHYLGEHPLGPGDQTWKEWWYDQGDSSEDWALMPFVPYGPAEVDMQRINAGPSIGLHYLGNDDTGRDLLTRLVHGAGTAVTVAVFATLLAMLIGIPLGLLAGFFGGWLDFCVLRIVEVFLCFPAFFLVMAVLAFAGSSTMGVILVLGLVYWTSFARIVRGELLSLREREFVHCAKGLGLRWPRILLRHLLPALQGPVLVNAAFVAASAIVVESTLSFLGLGPGMQVVSWGGILQQGKAYAYAGAWHLWLFPSLALVGTVICLHSLADRRRRVA